MISIALDLYRIYNQGLQKGVIMSTQFLQLLDNQRSTHYSAFVSELSEDARIAWYPSAGTDFRPLYFLNEAFISNNPPLDGVDPREPDIFLYTDYGIYNEKFEHILFQGANPIVHEDGRAKVTLSNIEYLGRFNFSQYEDFQLTDSNRHFYNRIFFFYATIESDEFGSITKPILYAFCCNEQICSELMIPARAKVSHVIHVRYGHGFGGGNCSGHWIQHVLTSLRCEMYIHDGRSHYCKNEHRIIAHFGDIIPQEPISIVKTIREIDGHNWSESNRILWQEVKRNPELFPRYKPAQGIRYRRMQHMLSRMNKTNLYNILE